MSLLGFVTLFIAFSYENKLLNASKIKQQILRPYALTLEEIILNFSQYSIYITKDFLLNYIYWVFLIVSGISITTWGIVISLYTNFNFFAKELNYIHIINITELIMWGVLSFLLISISILLNLIRLNKDPLDKGYLLNEKELSNIEIIKKSEGDLQELFFKISPTITLHQIPQEGEGECDLSIHFPLKLSNIRFVAKIYNANKDIVIRMFGVMQNIDKLGESYSHVFTKQINPVNLEINENAHCELKFYDNQNKIVSLLKLKAKKTDDFIKFYESEKVDLNMITNDNDYRDIENSFDEFIDFSM
ncbi:hypothetical protein CEQ21_16095 [Niallia circulans]|uniref:Uncharacterized protein n=2 Tax=Niallia circulans TaxID=1397 RepID=A0A553SQ05_NIACI|nr:hypothetical protein CEQ21_16095 [Niallia circulans]